MAMASRALLTAVVALLLAACGTGATIPDAVAPRTDEYPPLPTGLPRAEVVRVVDGDTIDVAMGGRTERVRLLGIDTPESVDPRRPVECFGLEASAQAQALLDGQTVLLEADPSQDAQDRNGRLLRYVWLPDGRMANLEQIAGGYAFEFTFNTPYRYREHFRTAEDAARTAGLGLWASDTCAGQSLPANQRPAATSPGQGTQPDRASCPSIPDPERAANTPVRIIGLDKDDEVVRLANNSTAPISLDGWLLCSVRGGETHPGLAGTLDPGETRVFPNTGQTIWSNGQRDDAALFDPNGRLVSYWEDQ